MCAVKVSRKKVNGEETFCSGGWFDSLLCSSQSVVLDNKMLCAVSRNRIDEFLLVKYLIFINILVVI